VLTPLYPNGHQTVFDLADWAREHGLGDPPEHGPDQFEAFCEWQYDVECAFLDSLAQI
jgi:hypothetical protein